MLVAAISHLSKGDGLGGASHAIELGIVFLSLILIGAVSIALTRSCARIKRRVAKLNGGQDAPPHCADWNATGVSSR